MVTGAAVVFLTDSAKQGVEILFLSVLLMFVSESTSPFEPKSNLCPYRCENGIILASMHVDLVLKVDLSAEGSQSSSTIPILLIAANVFVILL